MIHLQSQCPLCGAVELLSPTDVVVVSRDGDPSPPRVRFRCVECDHRVYAPVPERLADLLEARGARRAGRSEAGEAGRPPTEQAPPFTHDDLLDFHLLLERPDWFDLLLATPEER